VASKIDDDRTAFERAIDWCNQLFVVVVLCVLWSILTRIEQDVKNQKQAVDQVEKKIDAIDELMNETIGDEKWREVQKQ